MNQPKDKHGDLLERAVTALKSASSNDAVPAYLVERTMTSLTIEKEPPVENISLAPRIERSNFDWRFYAIAATVLLLFGFVIVHSTSSNYAFAAVLENIRNAATLRMNITFTAATSMPIQSKLFVDDQKMRMEMMDGTLVMISDMDSGKIVTLDLVNKKGTTNVVKARAINDMTRPFEQLRAAKSKDAHWIGNETIHGRATEIFEIQNGKLLGSDGIPELRVWVDRESQLPVKIVAEDRDPKSEMRVAMENIQWNVPLAESLFDVRIPSGYAEGNADEETVSPPPSKNIAMEMEGVVVLACDAVPRSLVWATNNNKLIAIMTDAENVPIQKTRVNELHEFNMANNQLLRSKKVSTGSRLSLSQSREWMAYAIGREVQLVSSENGDLKKAFTTAKVLPELAISNSGNILVTASNDWQAQQRKSAVVSTIEAWNVDDTRKLFEIAEDSITAWIAIAPDGTTMVTADNDKRIKLWNLQDGKMLHQFEGYQRAAFSPNGKELAIVAYQRSGESYESSIEVYRLTDFSVIRSLKLPDVRSTVLSLAYSNDGTHLAVGSWDGKLTVWDLANKDGSTWRRDLKSGIHALVFSPDGRYLASGSEDGCLRLWTLPR